MFIYFLALSPACYMRPMCMLKKFFDVILVPIQQILHLNACFCSILLITAKTKPHNIDVTRRNSQPQHRPENDSDMHQHPLGLDTKVINKIFISKPHHTPQKADTLR